MFVYDASSKLIAEYSNQTPENPNTSYVATDTLLSVRLVTDRNGNVVSRRDFKPFGEDLAADGSARKTADNYSTSTEDKVRQRFTGYQKDIETGLDFAEARMHENRHGRFTAVDPLLASGKSANPQTFNRFTYVSNRPLADTDSNGTCPDGKCPNFFLGTVYSAQDASGTVFYNNEIPKDTKLTWSVLPVGTDITFKDINGGDTWRVWNYGADSESKMGWERVASGYSFIAIEASRHQLVGRPFWDNLAAPRPNAFDTAMNNVVRNGGGNIPELTNAVVSDPRFYLVDRVTNPDGVTVKLEEPFSGFGGSVTITRDFDVLTSSELSVLDGPRLRNWFSLGSKNGAGFKGLYGGLSFVSINATWIAERDLDRQRRTSFFEGSSATIGACARFCGGVTRSGNRPDPIRTGFSLGFSPGTSGGLTTSNGTFRGNPNRWFFGPTIRNGNQF